MLGNSENYSDQLKRQSWIQERQRGFKEVYYQYGNKARSQRLYLILQLSGWCEHAVLKEFYWESGAMIVDTDDLVLILKCRKCLKVVH